MVKQFKDRGKLVSGMKANIPLIKRLQRSKLKEEAKKTNDRFITYADEFDYVKNFANTAKASTKKPTEFYFDMKGDGKPLNKKKESRIEKMNKPFTLRNGKKHYAKFHNI